MRQSWLDVTFLHWPYQPEVVQRLLPEQLPVETWDGQAWVALVLLRMRVRPPVGGGERLVATFPETNVRTYVRGPGGEPGVWFWSLDADHLPAVLTARVAWGLPYFWSRMRVDRDGDRLSYRCVRRGGGQRPARHDVAVRVGPAIPAEHLGDFDHYLTARFTLWNRYAGLTWRTPAEHPPWALHRAEVERLDESLVAAVGLPEPDGEPIAHHSPGVDVALGAPHGYATSDRGRRA